MTRSICIVSDGYPTKNDPFFSFVGRLAEALSEKGVEVFVISPQSIVKHWFRGSELHPKYTYIASPNGKAGIHVYQPYLVTFGNRFQTFSKMLSDHATNKAFKKVQKAAKIDVCYGHFWHSAFRIYPLAKKNSIPLFVACGESNVILENAFNKKDAQDFFKYIKGVICVSTKNLQESVEAGFTDGGNCVVIPNAINAKLFHKKDKEALREKYGYSKEDFIVAYCGSFEQRKGSKRLSQAIDSLKDSSIKSFFIGKGLDFRLEDPDCEGILFKGTLGHDVLPDYLNMADVFCLPTLQEGCCNAIVEALACGLPVISSDRNFNYDILDESNSIMIDPMNVEQIAKAIKLLKDDKELRQKLADGALIKGKELSIDQRASKIINFINSKI